MSGSDDSARYWYLLPVFSAIFLSLSKSIAEFSAFSASEIVFRIASRGRIGSPFLRTVPAATAFVNATGSKWYSQHGTDFTSGYFSPYAEKMEPRLAGISASK